MTNMLLIAVAIAAGGINALQLAMLGNIRLKIGSFEATTISTFASLAGLTLVVAILAQSGYRVRLPAPFSSPFPYLFLFVIMTTSLLVAGRDIPPQLLLTGLTSIPYLLAAAYVGPRIGLGVYFAAVVTGQLTASTTIDHFGAFGTQPHPIDLVRALGIVVLLVGVVMIRGRQ